MKKLILAVSILLSVVCFSSCTNDEGNNDLDILNPNDTIQSVSGQLN
ncbi:hypothetical protein [Spongiimicrobium sp. 3-5]